MSEHGTPADIAPGDLLTYEQAGAYLGVSPRTVHGWVTQGKLARADNGPKRGGRALFRASDLEPLRDRWGQLQERRRQTREAILSAGKRTCTRCGDEKALEEFYTSQCGVAGRTSICGRCQRAAASAYIRRPEVRERRRRYKRMYEQTETHKAYRRAYQKRLNQRKDSPAYSARRIYHARRYRILTAVEDGKRSPLCRRHGFALARDRQQCYRPVRLDQPMPAGCHAVAHYAIVARRWVCLAPPLTVNPADAQTLRYLMAREKGKTNGRRRSHPQTHHQTRPQTHPQAHHTKTEVAIVP